MPTSPVRGGGGSLPVDDSSGDENRVASTSRSQRATQRTGPSRRSTSGPLQNLPPAAAARARAMARMAAQQRAANTSLASLAVGGPTNGVAADQARQLSGQGNITTRSEATARLLRLSPRIQTQDDCDALRDALESDHHNGLISLQTYRVYAESLIPVRQHNARDAARRDAARIAVESGAPAGWAIAEFRVTHPEDIADIRNAAATGGPRAAREILRRARGAVEGGMTAEQAIAVYRLRHPEDIAHVRRVAAGRRQPS